MFDAEDAPDPEKVYRNDLETCRRLGIEPTPRERALGLIQAWTPNENPAFEGGVVFRIAPATSSARVVAEPDRRPRPQPHD